jgi:hypothetical protein
MREIWKLCKAALPYYLLTSFLIRGIQVCETSKLGWLIGLVKHAMWAAFLYFLCLLLLSVCRISLHVSAQQLSQLSLDISPIWTLVISKEVGRFLHSSVEYLSLSLVKKLEIYGTADF